MQPCPTELPVQLHLRVPARPAESHRVVHPVAIRAKGQAAQTSGDLDLAIQLFQHAADLSGGATPELLALGEAFESAGRLEDAVQAYEWAARRSPAMVQPMRALARVLHALGRFAESDAFLSRLLTLNPVDVNTRVALGAARRARGDRAGALAVLDGAVRQVPKDGAAALELAQTLVEVGEPEKALRALQRAGVSEEPRAARVVARCIEVMGDPEVARVQLIRARNRMVEASPDARDVRADLVRASVADGTGDEAWARAVGLLSSTARPTPAVAEAVTRAALFAGRPQDALPVVQDALAGPSSVAERARLAFCRGDLLDAMDQTGPAFLSWLEGNHADPGRWSRDQAWDEVEQTKAWFSPAALRRGSGAPRASDVVVVVGAPGSGANLVATLLADHPATDRAPLGAAVQSVREALPRRVGRPWPDCMDWLAMPRPSAVARRAMGLPSQATRTSGRTILRLGARGLLDVGAVPSLLPGARVVLVTRNPWDQAVSVFHRRMRGRGLEHTTRMGDIAAAADTEAELIAHWRASFRRPMVEVSYDALVARPTETLGQLSADLDLGGFPPSAAEGLRTRGLHRWSRYARWLGPVADLSA